MVSRPGSRAAGPAAAVILASTGAPFAPEVVRAAADAAHGGRVAVVSIARLYGFALGLPNPGLLPTASEREAQTLVVSQAARQLDGWGLPNDAEVVITRNPSSSIVRIARGREAKVVAIQTDRRGRLRTLVEGRPGPEAQETPA